MNPFPKFTKLYDVLWPESSAPSEKLYTVLDGARDSRAFGAVDASYQNKYCLYSGQKRWPGDDLSWDLVGISPYLVEMEQGTDLAHFVLRHGWCENWGIFCRSEVSIGTLRNHFRGLLIVKNEANRKLLFRFYDPRVLRAYLPTCTAPELRTVFGPVSAFVVPGEDPSTAIEYRYDGVKLVQEELLRREVITMTASGG
jgi:hypothetical protein